jgi:hypothetical protein
MNIAMDDNDDGENLAGQNGHHILWQVEGARSPFGGGETIWVVPLELSPAATMVTPGDFDNDKDVDANDIDAIGAAIRTNQTGAQFDLNKDGSVNNADRTFLIENIKKSYIGDADLDGTFGTSDFVKVFVIGEYEDAIQDNSGWADGDWNNDQDFDSGDFVAAFIDGGFEKGPRAAVSSVPEPSTGILALIVLFGLVRSRRRK